VKVISLSGWSFTNISQTAKLDRKKQRKEGRKEGRKRDREREKDK
jgi:hypothetical protein